MQKAGINSISAFAFYLVILPLAFIVLFLGLVLIFPENPPPRGGK